MTAGARDWLSRLGDVAATPCRMAPATVHRIGSGTSTKSLWLGGAATIVVGAGAYGATMGLWRSPEQAVYGGIKLVVLFVGLLVFTTLTNAVLSGLLRARLSWSQVATCCMLGLAATAAILGALAPVSWWFVRHAPPLSDNMAESLATAHQLLAAHVGVFAVAGVLGVHRMYGLLRALVDQPAVARPVLMAWLVIEGLVGAELSWVLRPFVGKPDLPVTFVRADAFGSSVLDELGRITAAVGGPMGPWLAAALSVLAVALVAASLRGRRTASFAVEFDGLRLQPNSATDASTHLPWPAIAFVRRLGVDIEIGCIDRTALRVDTIALPCGDADSARAAFETIETARHGHRSAPFRGTSPSG